MKTVEVNITGNSLLAYVTLFDEDMHGQLNEMEEGGFDYHDFRSEHEKNVPVRDVAFAKTAI